MKTYHFLGVAYPSGPPDRQKFLKRWGLEGWGLYSLLRDKAKVNGGTLDLSSYEELQATASEFNLAVGLLAPMLASLADSALIDRQLWENDRIFSGSPLGSVTIKPTHPPQHRTHTEPPTYDVERV